jgi:predicted dehydrogenase
MHTSAKFARRDFIRTIAAGSLAAGLFPTIIPSSALGRGGAVAPSERVAMGAIGVGDRGQDVMRHFLQQKECQFVALCDVKEQTLQVAKRLVDEKYQNKDCATHHDFRELLARRDIDAVMIASTDHWHVLHALAAVQARKDVYLEKPMGLSLAEDQALRKEVLRRKAVFQFGTQQRSDRKFRFACELVRNGYIGQLKHINTWCQASRPGGPTTVTPPPADLDYNFWLGPAAERPYTQDLVASGWAKNWWYVADFALGFIAGWGVHPLDIALWGAGDLARGTWEVEGRGVIPRQGICNTAVSWDVNFKFSSGVTMQFVSTPNGGEYKFVQEAEWKKKYRGAADHGTAFEGTNGWIRVDRGNISTEPEGLIEINDETFKTRLHRSPDHVRDFLGAIRSRQSTVCPIREAVEADAICHVSDIALRLGRKLTYKTDSEKFVNDKDANQRLKLRDMRKPWRI